MVANRNVANAANHIPRFTALRQRFSISICLESNSSKALNLKRDTRYPGAPPPASKSIQSIQLLHIPESYQPIMTASYASIGPAALPVVIPPPTTASAQPAPITSVSTTAVSAISPSLSSSAVGSDADDYDVSYEFLYDEIQIRSKNFHAAELGTKGSGLEQQVGECDAITEWSFETTPTDPTYQ
ncbi:MAG: hypothetical protein M1827_006889 [Pycnora praestabilis]|nr:MAG: hypothetical protein M1827_006889 [Pycnora praestabilis]